MEEPSSQVISEWKLVNSKFSFIMYADPFEWQGEKGCPVAGLHSWGVLVRAGNGGHASVCGETCALPCARVSGRLISVYSKWKPMPAGVLAGGHSLRPQNPRAHPWREQGLELFAFVALGGLETKWFLSLFSCWLIISLLLPSIHLFKKHYYEPAACQALW